MRKFWTTICLAAMAAFLFAGIALQAQDNAGQDNSGQTAGRGHMRMGGREGMRMSPEQRADRMAKALNLSDDQKSKVLDILNGEQKQMSDLRADTSLSQQDRRSKMREMREGTASQIRALLNSDQQQKYDQMQQRMKERMEHNRRGSGAQGQNPGQTQAPPQ